MMLEVALALAPIGGAGVYFFGLDALAIIAITVVSAWLADLAACRLAGRALDWRDASPAVTGLLLAYTLPPTVPWFVAVAAALAAILIGKQLFGGLGANPFNPALVGRVLAQWAYPEFMNLQRYPVPLAAVADAVTAASPLDSTSTARQVPLVDLALGLHGGAIGETCAVLIVVCGLYLVARGVIELGPPVSCVLTAYTLAMLLPAPAKLAGHAPYLAHNPVYQVLSGGLLLAAFFFVNDPVTTPLTPRGRVLFATGAGAVSIVIRHHGPYPDGVAYAVLLMNALRPLIDRVTLPAPLGARPSE
jgi:electron transport complex protein RnfD